MNAETIGIAVMGRGLKLDRKLRLKLRRVGPGSCRSHPRSPCDKVCDQVFDEGQAKGEIKGEIKFETKCAIKFGKCETKCGRLSLPLPCGREGRGGWSRELRAGGSFGAARSGGGAE